MKIRFAWFTSEGTKPTAFNSFSVYLFEYEIKNDQISKICSRTSFNKLNDDCVSWKRMRVLGTWMPQTKLNDRTLNLERSKNRRGKIALIRIKLTVHFRKLTKKTYIKSNVFKFRLASLFNWQWKKNWEWSYLMGVIISNSWFHENLLYNTGLRRLHARTSLGFNSNCINFFSSDQSLVYWETTEKNNGVQNIKHGLFQSPTKNILIYIICNVTSTLHWEFRHAFTDRRIYTQHVGLHGLLINDVKWSTAHNVRHRQIEKKVDELKTIDTIGNCQRPVFSLGVSQHKHKITKLWKC